MTTIPAGSHPLVQLIFAEMARQGVSYAALSERAGILPYTLKMWRTDNRPSLHNIEAALGALGFKLVAAPS